MKTEITNTDTGEKTIVVFETSLLFNLWVNRNYTNHTWNIISFN